MAISCRRDGLTLRSTLTTLFLVAAAAASLLPHMARAQITAERVEFPAHPDSDLGATGLLSGVLYRPAGAPFPSHSKSAVVLLHGCPGMWSSRDITKNNTMSHWAVPNGPDLQTNIEKWAIKLAQSGIFALALDSYTKRKPASAGAREWQNQCAEAPVPPNGYPGYVSPYTQRVFDLRAAYTYLSLHADINSLKVGSVGWSQGAETTMIEAALTDTSGAARSNPTPIIRTVSIYPGCGLNLGFGSPVSSSFWSPLYPMHLHVGMSDPKYGNCETRAINANSLHPATPVTFPTDYNGAIHSYDSTPLTPIEAWPTFECTRPMTGDECAMRSTDISSLAFLQQVL